MNTFWMVWNPVGRAPTVKHSTFDLAKTEASRLAETVPGQNFIILQSVGEVAAEKPKAIYKKHVKDKQIDLTTLGQVTTVKLRNGMIALLYRYDNQKDPYYIHVQDIGSFSCGSNGKTTNCPNFDIVEIVPDNDVPF